MSRRCDGGWAWTDDAALSRACFPSYLLQPSGCVFVQQTRDQGLVGQPFCERALLNRLEVLAREPDVQPPVFAESGLRVTHVASPLTLAAAGGLPLASLDRHEHLLLIGVNLHGRTPPRSTASWPSTRDDRLREDRVLVLDERHP